jgi:hypothetical protein
MLVVGDFFICLASDGRAATRSGRKTTGRGAKEEKNETNLAKGKIDKVSSRETHC